MPMLSGFYTAMSGGLKLAIEKAQLTLIMILVIPHNHLIYKELGLAPLFPLEQDDVAIFDKAFTNFAWYASLLEKGIYFVTRLKRNTDYQGVERRSTAHLMNIYSDQIIEFKGFSFC